MNFRFKLSISIIFFTLFLGQALAQESYGPTVLTADKIDGDKNNNTISASGNVEVTKGKDKLISDIITYDKNNKTIQAQGNIEVKSEKFGNIFASEAKIKDDLTSGEMKNGKIIFEDGSYVVSPKIDRESKSRSIFNNSIFSFCPNYYIVKDKNNVEKDNGLINLKAKSTTIDKEDGTAKIKDGVLRIKKVPIFYTPYLSFPLREAKRKSGFLNPSYLNTNRLGFGLKIPYYFNIAPNKDLITTLQYHPSGGHMTVKNKFRHLIKNGTYNVDAEVSNNKLKQSENIDSYRWALKSGSKFDFSNDIQFNSKIDYLGDKNYLRDYYNDFIGYKVSQLDLDQIKNNDYNSIKLVKIQELESDVNSKEEPYALPIINSYFESKPGKIQETYSFLTNGTVIYRKNGLQYRRMSVKPEINIPYNLNGNIFKLTANTQGDIYNINEKNSSNNTDFDHNETAYRPELAASWSLPLIKKSQNYSFIFEPKANFVTSTHNNNDSSIPNEDSSNTELTQSNLFINDRFVGFDRSESGQRINYGFNSKLYNSYGRFTLGLGQGYRRKNKSQDVVIRGFSDEKSNIVGEVSYKSKKILEVSYNFQLNESNYSNDVNDINLNLNFDNFSISSNYILIHENESNKTEARDQISVGVKAKIYGNLKGTFEATKDFASNRIISEKIGILYDGCCVSYGISFSENNPSNYTQAQRGYNINFKIKNL